MLLLMNVFREKKDITLLAKSKPSTSCCKLHHLHSMGYRSETNRQEGIAYIRIQIHNQIQNQIQIPAKVHGRSTLDCITMNASYVFVEMSGAWVSVQCATVFHRGECKYPEASVYP